MGWSLGVPEDGVEGGGAVPWHIPFAPWPSGPGDFQLCICSDAAVHCQDTLTVNKSCNGSSKGRAQLLADSRVVMGVKPSVGQFRESVSVSVRMRWVWPGGWPVRIFTLWKACFVFIPMNSCSKSTPVPGVALMTSFFICLFSILTAVQPLAKVKRSSIIMAVAQLSLMAQHWQGNKSIKWCKFHAARRWKPHLTQDRTRVKEITQLSY